MLRRRLGLPSNPALESHRGGSCNGDGRGVPVRKRYAARWRHIAAESSVTLNLNDLALDIGGSSWTLGQLNAAGKLQVIGGGPTGPADEVMSTIAALLSDVRMTGSTLGCSFPGGLDRKGIVRSWPNRPDWHGVALSATLRSALGAARVVVRDDGYCAALGEATLGVAADLPDHLALVWGTGLGGAVVSGGRVLVPRPGDARGVGHIRGLAHNRMCPCGGTGCLQLALKTLPRPAAGPLCRWDDGVRVLECTGDLARALGLRAIVLSGGRLHRPDLRAFLMKGLIRDGLDVRCAKEPGRSSLFGALVADATS